MPTTYAGSEMTTIYGLTGGRHKQTGTSPVVLPRVVVYDPQLTLGLPPNVTGPSAFNALAHSVEALWATGCNPVTTALALEGVRAIARSLPTVMADRLDVDGRSDLLYGAYLSGIALGTTSAGLHHKLCHVLGGTFNLVHADAHAAVLPHAVAFNAPALPDEMARLADALGAPGGDPAGALWDLAAASSVTTNLAALGLTAADLPEAAQRAAGDDHRQPGACRRRRLARHPPAGVRRRPPAARPLSRDRSVCSAADGTVALGWPQTLGRDGQPPDFAFQRSRPARARSSRWAGTRWAAAETALPCSPPAASPAAAAAGCSSGATRSSNAGGCIPGCQ